MPSNPFALLATGDDEETETTTTKAPQEAPKVLKPSQPQGQANKAPKDKAPKPPKESKPNSENKEAGTKQAQGQGQGQPPRQRKPRPQNPPSSQGQDAAPAPTGDDPAAFDKPKGERRHGGRDKREGYNNRNERQSHHRVLKTGKEGHGVGNWGSQKEEIAEEAKVAVAEPEGEAPAAEETTEATAAEEGPKQLSYEEYLRQKQSKRAAAPSLPSVRKAGEGEDNSKWQGAQELTKESEDSADDKLGGERKSQRVYKKQTVNINVEFPKTNDSAAPSREGFRGGRGGRGGSRGGRGGNRGARTSSSSQNASTSAPAPAFNDAEFPKL